MDKSTLLYIRVHKLRHFSADLYSQVLSENCPPPHTNFDIGPFACLLCRTAYIYWHKLTGGEDRVLGVEDRFGLDGLMFDPQ